MTEQSIAYPTGNKKGYIDAYEGDGLVMTRLLTARGTVQRAVAPTLTCTTGCGTGVVTKGTSLSRAPSEDVEGGDGMTSCSEAASPRIDDPSEAVPEMEEGEVVAMLTPGRPEKRQNGPRYRKDAAFAITCQDRHGIASLEHDKLRIRFLTPLECWRLMGQPDWAYDAAKGIGTSDNQLYKQAGNSIVVDCLVAIFEGMYVGRTWDGGQRTLGEWM